MLVACRLAGLSALEGQGVSAQCGGACGCAARFFWVWRNGTAHRFPAQTRASLNASFSLA